MPSARPPSGTVTFLFTDIEGSTKLWEEHPEEMRSALARHDALVREAVEGAGGYVFKTGGDAFYAAFATAPDAVAAALTAQLALVSEPWPEATPVKARMAVHTGAVESRDGDYFGSPLNRAARLLGIGRGGQTLVSHVTYELTRDFLPAGAGLRELGEHRLKDLGRSEAVYQLVHPGLPSDFPPLMSLDHPALKHNLPAQLTSFVGREREMADIAMLCTKTRLLTLTGSGGCGKTRLAVQAAAEMVDGWNDGVWLVELAPLTDPALVPQAVAGVLGLKEEPGKPIAQTLAEHLQQKDLVLVLDNCEHLLGACASVADTLLRSCPRVLILATSREALGIAGETTYRIPSLSVPDPKQAQTPESVTHYESVRLFIDRAVQAQTHFLVTDGNAPALASVCYHLDGIPLAIELAAARVRSLSVEDIDGKLDQRFRLLTGGSRTALPRQQTLRSLIDWSYDLLSAKEKRLFERLCVFAGGWTLEAVEKVCAGEGVESEEVLDVLMSLVDKSLVVSDSSGRGVRYRLLDTVRQYARDRMIEAGDGELWRDRRLAHFLALAEEAEAKLIGADQVEWLARLEVEHDNLQAALAWCQARKAEEGLRLAGALGRFWHMQSHVGVGRDYLREALACEGAEHRTAARAKALAWAGSLASSPGEARACHEESLSIQRELGNRLGIATSLGGLASVAYGQGDYGAAKALFEESLSIQRELGYRWGAAGSLNSLGAVAYCQGDYKAMKALHEESLSIRRELGDERGIALSLGNLGYLAYLQSEYSAARALQEKSLSIRRELGDKSGTAVSLHNLGNVAVKEGDYALASSCLSEAASIAKELGDKRIFWDLLQGWAGMARAQLRWERAALLWGAAEGLPEGMVAELSPREREERDRDIAATREALGEQAFSLRWAEGRAMTMEQAIDLVLNEAAG